MNDDIKAFLDNLQIQRPQQFQVAERLYEIVHSSGLQFSERIIYGGIGFFLGKTHFGGIYSYNKHTSIVFSKGFLMSDEKGLLEGGGKFRRHLSYSDVSNIVESDVQHFFKQGINLCD